MKIVRKLYYILCLCALLALPVHAYLDPSVVTFTIQVVAGVAVVVGATVGILWRRARKKVKDKLGIDENANKEVEEEVVEYDEI